MHPDYADPMRRAALYRLFDRVWRDLAVKIETASRFGWRWDEVTTPFARYRDSQALAHTGVIELPVLLDGVEHEIAGLHAVCTDPDHRRQGHYRATMEAALRFVDERWSIAKLCTGQPELYEPFGFRVIEQHRFLLRRASRGWGQVLSSREVGASLPKGLKVSPSERSGVSPSEKSGTLPSAPAQARSLGESDLPWLRDVLAHRTPVSRRFASLDPGWLFGIDEVLWTGGLSHLYAVGDAVVAWEATGEGLQIYDVACKTLPSAEGSRPATRNPQGITVETLLAACPWPFERVVFWFTPDLLAPESEPIPWPEDDVLMVRGPWPVAGPFAVSPLAAH